MAAVCNPLACGASAACRRSLTATSLLNRASRACGFAATSRVSPSTLTRKNTCVTAAEQVLTKAKQPAMTVSSAELHANQAWEFWKRLGSPKYQVAPMVDQVYNNVCILCLLTFTCRLYKLCTDLSCCLCNSESVARLAAYFAV